MPIAVQPSQANQIRAYKQAHPAVDADAIARHFGVQPVLVRNALGRGDKRRLKSAARL